jgi:ATP adenylyltransferase
MNYIWSPWRMKYIMKQDASKGCVFCDALDLSDGPENLVVHRSKYAFVILNRYPYTSGHVLVVPFVHTPSYENLDPEERAEMMELINQCTRVLRPIYHPEAFNIGANLGTAAGAGIAEHVHFHIVPRWEGDTNFLSTVSNTRVLPETLEDTYWRIKNNWK